MAQLTLESIKNSLKKNLPTLRKKYSVETIGVFGSYVRNEQQDDSDVDILVTFDKTISLFDFVDLGYLLSDLLGIKVDLVPRDTLKLRIGKQILSEVVMI